MARMTRVKEINAVPSGCSHGPVHLAVLRESEDVALLMLQHLLLCGLDVNLR
jgi:hypothetical protein